MYKPGDRIRIRENCKWYPWYNEEVFIIVSCTKFTNQVSLDRNVFEEYGAVIATDYITHEYLYERKDKLLKLKKRICLNQVKK